MRPTTIIAIAIVLFAFGGPATSAQRTAQKCHGPIYTEQQVTRRASIKQTANLEPIFRSFGNTPIHAVLDSILCRSGKVTDIEVVEMSPAEVRDFVIAALSLIEFTPAEMNWHTASQRHRFAFDVNWPNGSDATITNKAEGRLIEEIDVIGNRKLTKEQILSWTHSRAGQTYDANTVSDDLRAILRSGLIDAEQSRVTIEDGLRGGVIIHFEIVELRTIVAVKFSGLKEANQIALLNSLVDRRADIRVGAPLDAAKLNKGKRVIIDSLQSKGWLDVQVNVLTENLSGNEASITFAIAGHKSQ